MDVTYLLILSLFSKIVEIRVFLRETVSDSYLLDFYLSSNILLMVCSSSSYRYIKLLYSLALISSYIIKKSGFYRDFCFYWCNSILFSRKFCSNLNNIFYFSLNCYYHSLSYIYSLSISYFSFYLIVVISLFFSTIIYCCFRSNASLVLFLTSGGCNDINFRWISS